MIEVIGSGIALICGLLWAVQVLLFHYLETSNNHSGLPFFKIGSLFRLFTFYDTRVKAKDEQIRKVRDLCLALSGYTLLTGILFVTVVVIFNLK